LAVAVSSCPGPNRISNAAHLSVLTRLREREVRDRHAGVGAARVFAREQTRGERGSWFQIAGSNCHSAIRRAVEHERGVYRGGQALVEHERGVYRGGQALVEHERGVYRGGQASIGIDVERRLARRDLSGVAVLPHALALDGYRAGRRSPLLSGTVVAQTWDWACCTTIITSSVSASCSAFVCSG
jgi:hypothetical protein